MAAANGLELLAVFVVAGGGAYLGSYLREKGKNLATREDIERITLITEQTKAEISRQLWEIQTRWSFKRDLYVRLLEGLADTAFVLRQLSWLDRRFGDPRLAGERAETERGLNENLDAMNDHMTKLRAAQAVAPLVAHQDTLSTLDDLLVAWVNIQHDYNAETFEALREHIIRAMAKLAVSAKKDLFLGPDEGHNKE